MVEKLTEMAGGTGLENATLGELLGYGGKVTILGVCVVFLALVALIFLTWLYPKVIKAIKSSSESRKMRKAAAVAESKSSTTKTQAVADATAAEAADDKELIAVISAAVAAAMGTSTNGIVIKSLRRSGANVSSWGRESRSEQVYNRF